MSDPLIDPAVIAELSLIDASAMPDTCTVHQAGTPLGPLACRFTARSGGQEQAADLIKERGQYEVHLALGLVVESGVILNLHLASGDRQFTVVWTPPVTGYSTHLTLGLEEIR